MKITKFYIILSLLLLITISLINGCRNQTTSSEKTDNTEQKNSFESPADLEIKAAGIEVEKNPGLAGNHVKLAAAILKKVRETGDYSLNREAEISINKALELESGDFAALFLQIQIYLSEHEFQKALDLAEKLATDNPNSEALLAAITDAKTELGRYDEAVKATQKFVDFRPNSNSYTRVAHMRSLYGDTVGAIEARKLALNIADPDDKENLAWHHSQLGKEYFEIGRFAEAESEFDLALNIFPDYHLALAGKGRVRAAQNDLLAASGIFEQLNKRVFEANRAIFLGDIYQRLGKKSEARQLYDEIVRRERESQGDMHRIALFWADHDENLDEALAVARADREQNGDLLSSDTLAWCLYKKGEFREAKKYITEAMRLKTKSSLFYYHAGMIENGLGNKAEALRFLKLTLATNPSFDLLQAEIAKKTLAELETKQ